MSDKSNPFAAFVAQIKAQEAKVKVGSAVQSESPKSPEVLMEPTVEPAALTPPPVNPLTNLLTPITESQMPAQANLFAVGGAHELANMNTESFEPKDKVTPSLTLKAQQKAGLLTLSSSQEVRELCDTVDKMMDEIQYLAGPSLIQLRGYVQSLMITLKEHPEFDSVILDSDVNNVMRYVRATREEAVGLRDVKTVKKAVRSAKKEGLSPTVKKINTKMADAFAAIMNPKFGK